MLLGYDEEYGEEYGYDEEYGEEYAEEYAEEEYGEEEYTEEYAEQAQAPVVTPRAMNKKAPPPLPGTSAPNNPLAPFQIPRKKSL